MIYFRLVFLLLFTFELFQTKFKYKRDKLIWFFIVLVFGAFGYSFFIAFRRRLIVKRKFKPNFKIINHKS